MKDNLLNFIQSNSPDGGFLQSENWRKFQESWERKTFEIEIKENNEYIAYANIITHELQVVGEYFYIPRGPIITQSAKRKEQNHSAKLKTFFTSLFSSAKENNIGWIRIEPNNADKLALIKESLPNNIKIKKSAVDMQPREILVLDIAKSEEELLGKMKQKTRYNIKLAEKRGVQTHSVERITQKYVEEFLRLVKITSERDKIKSHPEGYYCKMFETIPSEVLKLYVAEYEGKIITANLVLFFGKTATYMHGASDNAHREAMAPYLLQWQAILDAKKAGCEKYDFGGIKTELTNNSWSGITKFKTGFAPDTKPIEFPGSYDIVLNSRKYSLYKILQKIKKLF